MPMLRTVRDSWVLFEKTSGETGNSDASHGAGVHQKLRDILVDVASHYGCSSCALALRKEESLHVVALCSEGHLVFEQEMQLIDEDQFQLFHHHARRSLPTIIDDAAHDARLKHDPCVLGNPHVRFYAAAPIYSLSQECLGTLCIVDKQPNTCFSLKNAEYLCDQASIVASIVQTMTA
eukprot:TRINITY_DN51473_c0_g1_i1.p1 TRINITY_DN51473_c0_g1~~TRINITY_DN51473_c0_g1_i1.p1  ORF type:complete len:178 (-),score=22.59 TRINITY_DN51473_c0_g1_i1:205-738(-)